LLEQGQTLGMEVQEYALWINYGREQRTRENVYVNTSVHLHWSG
jgi:hypothetical protein